MKAIICDKCKKQTPREGIIDRAVSVKYRKRESLWEEFSRPDTVVDLCWSCFDEFRVWIKMMG